MDRLIALEKLMMSCQDKDQLSMLKDMAQSRKEIQVSLHFCNTTSPNVQHQSATFKISIGAQRETEGAGEQGSAVQSTGWRKGQHQGAVCLGEPRGSSAQEAADGSKAQQTAGCGPAPARSALCFSTDIAELDITAQLPK